MLFKTYVKLYCKNIVAVFYGPLVALPEPWGDS